jgi:maleamate amidohydrolase
MTAPWDAWISERDRAVFAASGYGAHTGPGDRPALLVVDVTYGFCGDRPEPILESITRYRTSCGEAAWAALPHIDRLLTAARGNGIPVFYTRALPRRTDLLDRGRWAGKNSRVGGEPADADEIVADIAPRATDVVIRKAKPSAFHGTPLLGFLIELGVDSLIVAGATTSGCVRATVVDGFSYNFHVSVAREAVFDRAESSHWIGLMDMDMKYADVLGVDDLLSAMGAATSAIGEDT